jgi:hypothetical protein
MPLNTMCYACHGVIGGLTSPDEVLTLRASRQRAPRRYSAPCGSRRLEFSLSPPATPAAVSGRAFTCSARKPGPGSCCLYAGHRLGSKRVSPDLSRDRGATPVLMPPKLFSTRQRQRARAHRSSSRSTPDVITSRLFPRRSPQRSSANADAGGLKPSPAGRLRRARQPPSLHAAPQPAHRPLTSPARPPRSRSQHHDSLQLTQHEAA